MKHVAFFGDSLGKGVLLNEDSGRYSISDQGFVSLFAEKADVELKNFSHFGSTVQRGQAEFERRQKYLDDTEWVIFEFGGNDSDFDWDQISARPQEVHEPKTPLPLFKDIYKDLIHKALSLGKKVLLLELPPVDWQKYYAWISRGRCGENILQWLGGRADFIYRWHELYNESIHQLASAMNVPLVDVRSSFLQRRDFTQYLCADGIHPNEKGYRLMAQDLVEAWKALI